MTGDHQNVTKTKVEDDELYNLLNLNDKNKNDRKKLDGDAIIRVVRQKPWLATQQYNFSSSGAFSPGFDEDSDEDIDEDFRCFPLIKAIMLAAPVEVIDVLCCPEALSGTTTVLHEALRNKASFGVIELLLEKQPNAVKEKDPNSCYRHTPLHVACTHQSPVQIISLLLDRCPEATKEKDLFHWCTPLHIVCFNGAPAEVVSLLLDQCPEATREKDRHGCTPLHLTCCYIVSVGVVSLLLDRCPEATRRKDNHGYTPLHSACFNGAEMDVILLLLETYPEAILETNDTGKTPADIAEERNAPEDIRKLLSYVCHLFDDELRKQSLEEIIRYFIDMQWWKGVWLVFNRHPALTQTINLDTSVKAYFLSAAGRHCKLTSMWDVIRNEQDLLAGV